MDTLGILFDDLFKRHLTGHGHPERPARLDAVRAALETSGALDRCPRIEPKAIAERLLLTLHTRDYIMRLESACRQGWTHIDVPDCPIGPDSYDIARIAAGGVVAATRRVVGGDWRRAFCAVRPPAHHAEADRAMGFCLLNHTALAARIMREESGVERTLILDWDVHHGNGTQHLFDADPSVLYISLHGHPAHLYPGTGYENETGVGPGKGYTLNVPIMPGTRDREYQTLFSDVVVPAIERYAPQLIIISNGVDAHQDDPLGNLDLSDETFSWMTEKMLELAGHLTDGRLVSILEGGYNLDVLQRCVADHVRLLMEA